MYCRQCGTQNDDKAWKCVKCGTPLHEAPPDAAAEPPIQIPSYLWQAVACTVLCCWPVGIPAIVFAAQVNTKVQKGDIEGAKASSKKAKMWCWIAFGSGIAVGIVYLALMLLGVLAGHAS